MFGKVYNSRKLNYNISVKSNSWFKQRVIIHSYSNAHVFYTIQKNFKGI